MQPEKEITEIVRERNQAAFLTFKKSINLKKSKKKKYQKMPREKRNDKKVVNKILFVL